MPPSIKCCGYYYDLGPKLIIRIVHCTCAAFNKCNRPIIKDISTCMRIKLKYLTFLCLMPLSFLSYSLIGIYLTYMNNIKLLTYNWSNSFVLLLAWLFYLYCTCRKMLARTTVYPKRDANKVGQLLTFTDRLNILSQPLLP